MSTGGIGARGWPLVSAAVAIARRVGFHAVAIGAAFAITVALPLQAAHATGHVIPAFARKYRTGCMTCHTAPPKLNVLGEAFRLNGYRLPNNPALVRGEAAIPLGEEPWKDLWPRAIWPGELPATMPLAVRVQSDIVAQRSTPNADPVRLLMPSDVYLLAGTSLGSGISAFVEAEWEPGEGVDLVQAKVLFQDVIPLFPKRTFNVLAGRQNLYLLSFGDRILDRSARRPFAWQEFRVSDVTLGTRTPEGEWRLGNSMPAISANGIVGGRFLYNTGVAQVASDHDEEGGRPLATYYALRYKAGGLRLDGQYDSGGGPGRRGYGQLHDRSIIAELFGYRGRELLADGQVDRQQAIGGALRLLDGPLDVGVGAVRRRDAGGWDDGVAVRGSSVFAKAEYLIFPWLIGSLKGERFRVGARHATGADGLPSETTLAPGVVMLLRQNVRLVVEGEWYARHGIADHAGTRRPHGAAARLEVSF